LALFVPVFGSEEIVREPTSHLRVPLLQKGGEPTMGRYLLLWLLGVPIPILVLIWIFGGLH
jgi:hypothetical protein